MKRASGKGFIKAPVPVSTQEESDDDRYSMFLRVRYSYFVGMDVWIPIPTSMTIEKRFWVALVDSLWPHQYGDSPELLSRW